jgi:hypothetical protein
MSGLANWVMQNRRNAIIGVAGFSLIPLMFWLAAAVLGLVVLRRGIQAGIPVLAWGALPAFVLWVAQGDATALIVLINIAILAQVLRQKISWAWVLFSAALMACGLSLIQPWLMADLLDMIAQLVLRVLDANGVEESPSKEVIITQAVIAVSVLQTYIAVAALLLSRRWQAKLFNPGGLRQEFLTLRLPTVMALALGAMVVVGESATGSLEILARAGAPALVVAGLAVVHGILAKTNFGMIGLVGFYLLGMVFGVIFTNLLIALAMIDSFVDIRTRLQKNGSN